MKHIHNTYLRVMSLDGYRGLETYAQTLDGLRNEIKRSQAKVTKAGYKAEDWLIVGILVDTFYNEDGTFSHSVKHKSVIERVNAEG